MLYKERRSFENRSSQTVFFPSNSISEVTMRNLKQRNDHRGFVSPGLWKFIFFGTTLASEVSRFVCFIPAKNLFEVSMMIPLPKQNHNQSKKIG